MQCKEWLFIGEDFNKERQAREYLELILAGAADDEPGIGYARYGWKYVLR